MKFGLIVSLLCLYALSFGQDNTNQNKFRQLGQELPTPNSYRAASGAPGYAYWQQKADYVIQVALDDASQRIYGEETITYTNNAPESLNYLWLQLDQNMRAKDSDTYKSQTSNINGRASASGLERLDPTFDGGFKIDWVRDTNSQNLPFTINKTMMRVDLPVTLRTGQSYAFSIKWWYNINNRPKLGGRSGYEYFEEDDNYLYTIAQFFPRMAVYSDVEGWQHKQFLGRGEFTLTFGDYDVSISVPSDHVVAATGLLQNPEAVLTKDQQKRYQNAQKSYESPVYVVTADEALSNEKSRASEIKTWHFKAENVRDFAFASSRKFIWDAMAVKQAASPDVLAMSIIQKKAIHSGNNTVQKQLPML